MGIEFCVFACVCELDIKHVGKSGRVGSIPYTVSEVMLMEMVTKN